jgi:hypothetical protein
MTRDCGDPHHCVTCSDEGVALLVHAGTALTVLDAQAIA